MTGQLDGDSGDDSHAQDRAQHPDAERFPAAVPEVGIERREPHGGEHRLVVDGEGEHGAREEGEEPLAAAVRQAGLVGARQAEEEAGRHREHVEDLGLDPEDVGEADAEQEERGREEGREAGRVVPSQIEIAHPDHRHRHQHVEEQHAVGAEDPGERSAEQRVDVGLGEVDRVPSVVGHHDHVVDRPVRELLEGAVDVPGLDPQVAVEGEALRGEVIGPLVRLEMGRQTGLAQRQRKQQEERRNRREGQIGRIESAAHGGAV